MNEIQGMNDSLSRRDALKIIAYTGAGIICDPQSSFTSGKGMLSRTIPSSGEKIPVVGLGTWRQFDVGNSTSDRKPLLDVLKKMSAIGGKIIDSSPMYARSEEVIGNLSQESGIADQFFLCNQGMDERQAGRNRPDECVVQKNAAQQNGSDAGT